MNLKNIFKKEKKDSVGLSIKKKESLSLFSFSPRFDWLCIILISVGILTFLLIKNYSVWSQVQLKVEETNPELIPADSKKIDEEKYSEIMEAFAKRKATYESIVGAGSSINAGTSAGENVATTTASTTVSTTATKNATMTASTGTTTAETPTE